MIKLGINRDERELENKMKHYLLSVWNIIDPIYFHLTRLHYVLDQEHSKTLFRVRLTRYKGSRVVLSDGTVILRNDLLIKLHLHNARLLYELHQIKSDIRRAVYIYHMIKRALPRLSHYIETHYRAMDIKGIIGITTLNRGAVKLGFEVIPIRNKLYRMYKTMTFSFINTLANHQSNHEPVYLFMSKKQLTQTYTTL